MIDVSIFSTALINAKLPKKERDIFTKKAQQMHDENHHGSGAKRDDYGIGVRSSADVFNEAMMFMEPSGASHCHLLIV